MMTDCTLWHGGARTAKVTGSATPSFEPISTSFLVLDTDRYGTTNFAYSEYGRVVQAGELLSAGRVSKYVGELYRESVSTGVPLVIVIEEPRQGFSFSRRTTRLAAMDAISSLKSKQTNKHVTVPRVAVLSRRGVTRDLFGTAEISAVELCKLHQLGAEKALGAPIGARIRLARSVCVAHSLSRSHLGEAISPKSLVGRENV